MAINNWRTRTPEEKEQIRAKIMELMIDGKARTSKEIEEEIGIDTIDFELDRLIHLEELVVGAMPEISKYFLYKVNSPYLRSVIYIEDDAKNTIACYRPYSRVEYW